MQKIVPNLWFNDQAEEAARLYTSLFKDSKIGKVSRYGKSGAEVSGKAEGSVLTVEFELAGYQMLALNGGPLFQFTPAISFTVSCETEEEIDHLWNALSEGGSALMPLQEYPFAKKYGWCQDKFGLSWQLSLSESKQKITPSLLFVQENANKGEEALTLYTSLFDDSEVETIARDEQTNSILYSAFTLAGESFNLMESGMKEHTFTFTPAISLLINCETQEEIDRLWNKLSAVPQAEQCGWVQDKYGVSWQITPTILGELMSDPDPVKAERTMKAMLGMKKLDIAALKEAYNNN